MKRLPLLTRFIVATLALIVAACGGGSVDDNDNTSSATPVDVSEKAGTVILAGDVTYESVPNERGALRYSKSVRKPVRGAMVSIMKAGTTTVLSNTTTDSKGRYSVAVPAGTSIAVRVWARTAKSSGRGRWDVSVRDNTRGNARYSMQTASFRTGNVNLERDVHAPSGWGGSRYTKTRVAAPFAVLDTVYSAIAKVRSAAPSTVFPPLSLYWSKSNTIADGDVADGEIGTSHFNPRQSGIYILGKADVDTDEYDDSVVAHEWGHYYTHSLSRDDSLGGSHGGFDEPLDRTVAFSEGWANAWSGIALARSTYADSLGDGQADGFGFSLSRSPSDTRGWFNESSIQYVIWHLHAKVGFKPIHLVMTGRLKSSRAITSIHSFAAALGAASPSSAGALKTLLRAQGISTSTSDAFGAGETNDAGLALALPLYHVVQRGAPAQVVCASYWLGSYNKLGNVVYVRVRALSAGTQVFTVTGPFGSDPDVSVSQGKLLKQGLKYGTREVLSVSRMAAGDAVLAIRDASESFYTVCFTIEID